MRAPLAASASSTLISPTASARSQGGACVSGASIVSLLSLLGLIALLSLSLMRPAAHLASGAVGR